MGTVRALSLVSPSASTADSNFAPGEIPGHPYLTIGQSPTLGIRGVLARTNIPAATVLEHCPVVLIPLEQRLTIEHTVLGNYYYEWDDTHDALVLGYGSLYNHRCPSNADYFFSYSTGELIIKSVREIAAGEEVTLNYNGEPTDPTPVKAKYLAPPSSASR
jgi:SET domain-containing protein